MKDMLDDIPDDELRRRLRNFEEEPDDDLWNKMEGAIPPPVRPMPEQLKNYAEVPDETVWRGIESGLRFEALAFRMEVAAGVLSVVSLLMLVMPLMVYSPSKSVIRYSLDGNATSVVDSLSDSHIEEKPVDGEKDMAQRSGGADVKSKELIAGNAPLVSANDKDGQGENVIASAEEKINPGTENQQLSKDQDVSSNNKETTVFEQEKINLKQVVQPSPEQKQKYISKNEVSTPGVRKKGLAGDRKRRSSDRKDENVSDEKLQSSLLSKDENGSNLNEHVLAKEEQKTDSNTDATVSSIKKDEESSKETLQLSSVQRDKNMSGEAQRTASDLQKGNTSGKDDQLPIKGNERDVSGVVIADNQQTGHETTLSNHNEKDRSLETINASGEVTRKTDSDDRTSVKGDKESKDVNGKVPINQDNQRAVFGNNDIAKKSGLVPVATDTLPEKDSVRRMTVSLLRTKSGETVITKTAVSAATDSIAKPDSTLTQLSWQKQKTAEPSHDKQKRESSKQRELGLYALVMPTLGYQEVRPLTQDNIFVESVDRISAFSSKRLGIRGEVGIERTLKRGWSVNAGLLYYQRKQSITYRYNDGSSVDVIELPGGSMSYAVQPRTLSGTFEYDVKNIGVLAGFNYSIKGKQFEQRVGMSGELHKPLSRSGEAGGKSIYLFANAYYRLSYRLSRRLDLMLQPTFNYSLQVDNRTNAPFYVKPYGLGLNFGVFYHF